jgi:hypothetical protein
MVKNGVQLSPIVYAIPVVAALLFWPGLFPIDDSYITLSNARVLLSGEPDPNYGTSYLTGATSPVHLLLVALGSLVIEPTTASMLIGVGGALLYFLGIERIVRSVGLSTRLHLALLLIGTAWGYSLFNYLNGLETSIAMAAAAWMLVLQDDKRKLPLLVGISPFIRPELAVLGGLLMLRLAWELRRRPWDVLAMGALGAAAALPWAAWVIVETGHPVPSTTGAKLAFFLEWNNAWGPKIVMTARALAGSLLLPLYIGLVGLRRTQWPGLVFVVVVVATSYWLMPNALVWNGGRYAAVFVPIFVAGLANIAAEGTRASKILLGALVAGTFVTAGIGAVEYSDEIAYARRVQDHAKFVATLPASATVLIHDAGQVAWARPKAKLVDMVGLKTLGIEQIHDGYSVKPCEWDRAFDIMARQYRATHVVVLDRWYWPCVADDLRSQGWHLNPVYADLYVVYELSRCFSADGPFRRRYTVALRLLC